jgi:hypothetical protein
VRVLLDEQVPKDLVPELVGHEVRTVGQLAWKGLENGELIARAAASFDVMITMDKRMPTELDVTRYRIGLVLIRASSNRIEALRPLVPAILQAIEEVRQGQVRRVGA